MTGTAGAPVAEPRDSVDMIIPWAEVQRDDQALIDGALVLVKQVASADVSERLGLPPGACVVVAVDYQRDDGSTRTRYEHPPAGLAAVRRPVTCALCGAVLARVAGGPWVRLDEPRRGDPFCGADGDEPQPHEPTVLDVADYARLRLALADLEEADARRCHH